MATFRKRGDTWSYRIDIGRDPRTNKRQQVTVSKSKDFPNGFNTKKEAQTAAAGHQYELDHGTHVIEKELLFKDLVQSWLAYYGRSVKSSSLRVRKHESYHLLSYFENVKCKHVTKKMYQDALIKLKDKLSDSTIDGVHTTGRMIFGYAVEFDIIKVNPTQFAKVHRTQKTVEDIENTNEVPKYLEKEQLSLFLRTAKENGLDGDYAIFLTLAYSGIRAGELCALKWSDFDFTDRTVSITKTYYNPNNKITHYELTPPKTMKSIRYIELSPTVFAELENHQARQNEIRMGYRKTYHEKGFVFANTENYPGYPIYIKTVQYRMHRILKLAGLDTNLTPHSLRHTHTSLLAEAGVGLQEIMDRLGHKDDDITKNVYMHVTKTMKKEASHKFDQLMKNL